MKIKFKKLNPEAKTPSYGHPGDAGFDVYAIEEVLVKAKTKVSVNTGLALEIPDGHAALVWDKSSISFNHGLKTIGGVIDSGYRGEVSIGLYNFSGEDFLIEKGNKVAQILIQKVETADFEESTELSETSRGAGGFGSTGRK